MGCKPGKVHAIAPIHIKQSDDIQFPVSTQISTTTDTSQIVTTENDTIQQTPPEQSNDAAKETEYVQMKLIAPDIDLTPVDDEAFSSALCQQREAAIDNISYRRAIDQWQPKSLEQLIDSIKVLSKNKNEIDQAWIIFYWISKNIRYDTQAYFNNNIGSQASTNVFFSRKAVCDGYAALYADLCTRIGLTCRKVSGYAKGYSFEARQKGFQKTNHAWNIISFKNGYSYFIESTWGSGHLDDSTKQYKAKLVPHYFLCRPEYMIYGHLPEDPQWQLLKKPLTMEQYLMLPRTYGKFFELNLKIVSPIYTHKATLETGKSYGEVLIAAPTSDIELSGSLRDESKTTIEGGDFVYFDRDENLCRCRFAPQKVGNHTILIFAGKKTGTTTLASSCTVEFTFDIDQIPTVLISYPYIWSHFFDYHLEIIKPVNTRYIDWPSDKNNPYCEILVRSHDDVYVSGKITNSMSGKTIENGSLFQEAKCDLFEPLNGVLKRESKVTFRCRIPGAHEVSITIDGQWLKNDSTFSMDENYLFQCEFQLRVTAAQLIKKRRHGQGREQQELDWVKYLKDKLVQFHSKVSSYGTNVATARGIQKLSSEFEILVFGPARVGKSTLIKEVSGDESIMTSAQMNACTTTSEKYLDKFNIQWWDTPGNHPFYHLE
ncbi:unnamed protein product [Rotaria socialis]